MSNAKADIPKLIERVYSAINDAEKHRGGSIVDASPLEIHLYNIATRYKLELQNFQALLEDANGTYLSEKSIERVQVD